MSANHLYFLVPETEVSEELLSTSVVRLPEHARRSSRLFDGAELGLHKIPGRLTHVALKWIREKVPGYVLERYTALSLDEFSHHMESPNWNGVPMLSDDVTTVASIIPDEDTPSEYTIKSTLLSFEQVYIPNPDDRDLISRDSWLIASGQTPIPIEIGDSPIVPLGKIPGHDERYEALFDKLAEARRQGAVKVAPSIQPAQPQFTLLRSPHWSGTPDPRWVYQVFRSLAATPEVLSEVAQGLDGYYHPEDLQAAATEGIGYPRNADDNAGDEPLKVMDRIALARVGSIVRSLAWCDLKGVQPITSDPGIESVLRRIRNSVSEPDPTTTASVPGWKGPQQLFVRLHSMLVREYINPSVIDKMSIEKILRLRTKAWGEAMEARVALQRRLAEMASGVDSAAEFDRACREEFERFEKARASFVHEAGNLLLVGPVGGLIHLMVGIGWTYAIPLVVTARNVHARLRELENVRGGPGFSIVRPYEYAKPKRRLDR